MKKFLAIFLLGLIITIVPTYFYLYRPAKLVNEPLILGHGGMGIKSSYPLNSSGSIKKALNYPVDGTEIDIRISLDDKLIAFHDSELNQNSNCVGSVSSTSAKVLFECQYNSLFHSEKISSLKSILDSNYRDGTTFSLDLKLDKPVQQDSFFSFEIELTQLTSDYPQYEFLIESQDKALLSLLKTNGVRAKLFYYGHTSSKAAEVAQSLGLDGVSINMKNVTKQEIESMQDLGFQVMIWGCGSVLSNREALKMGPDIIQTDDIPSMIKILERD